MGKNNLFYKFIRTILKPLMRVFFPYEIKGEGNLKIVNGRAYVLCSNHLSSLDPVFLLISNKSIIHFMAKAELFKNRFLKCLFTSVGAFSVERGKGDKKAINNAENILKNGETVGIFIEGTRSKTGEFLRPKSGSVLIACESKVPLIPVCITGGADNNKVKLFKKTVISYGEPIYLEKYIDEESIKNLGMLRKLSGEVMSKIKAMR